MPVRSHQRVRAPRLCDFYWFARLDILSNMCMVLRIDLARKICVLMNGHGFTPVVYYLEDSFSLSDSYPLRCLSGTMRRCT